MLTGRDMDILALVSKYGCITSKQAAAIFFNNSNQALTLSRRRLKKIHQNGELLMCKDWKTNQRVYYKQKKPSMHCIKCMDFYSQLVKAGCEILKFEREARFFKCVPDAFIACKHRNKGRMMFLEIDIYNNTNPRKYCKLFARNEFQRKYNIFPTIVIASDNKERSKLDLPFNIIRISLDMKDVRDKLIDVWDE